METGEDGTPRDKVKISRAQREIDNIGNPALNSNYYNNSNNSIINTSNSNQNNNNNGNNINNNSSNRQQQKLRLKIEIYFFLKSLHGSDKIDASDTELLLYHIKNVCIILIMILTISY